MNTQPTLEIDGWLYAIPAFGLYCGAAILLSWQFGAPILESEYNVEWFGVIAVLVLSCVLSEAYAKVDESAPVKKSSYFVLVLLAIAMVFFVMGLFFHVKDPFSIFSNSEVHGSETSVEFLFLLDVSPLFRPPVTVIFAHTLVISAIVGFFIQRRVARATRNVTDFT